MTFASSLFILTACGQKGVELYSEGKLVETVNVDVGKEYSFRVPARTGYRFLGWYDSESGGKALTDGAGKSAGLTWQNDSPGKLYAHFQAKTYTLVLNYNGATGQNTITEAQAVYDAEITAVLPVPIKSGFTFSCWTTDAAGKYPVTDMTATFLEEKKIFNEADYPVSEETTNCQLYAIWSEKMTTFTFVTNGGSAVADQSYAVGKQIVSLPHTEKDAYAFTNWCFDVGLTQPVSLPYLLPENLGDNVALYAKYEKASEYLTYTGTNSDREWRASYSGSETKIVVPDRYFGKKVTEIGKFDAPNAEEMILPDSIEELAVGCFSGLTALTSVRMSENVKRLPNNVFSGCVALQKINIPLNLETVGNSAFFNCRLLNELSLPQTVTTIGEGAFRQMAALKQFAIAAENQMFVVDDGVLYRKVGNALQLLQYPAAKDLDEFTPNPKTTKIFDYAFSACSLVKITLGGRINSIGENAFENSANLRTVIFEGEGSSSLIIGKNAFISSENLKCVQLFMNFVPTLGDDAFEKVNETFCIYVITDKLQDYNRNIAWKPYASKISTVSMIFGDYAIEAEGDGFAVKQYLGNEKNLILPKLINGKNITKIGSHAFSFNNKLESIQISANVALISNRAFYMCKNLVSVTMLPAVPPTLGQEAFFGVQDEFIVYIDNTPEVLSLYKLEEGWKEFTIYTKN